jgi:hypothetical protein
MSLDKLDIKIQEAAKNFKPEFGEEAWLKMKELLDEHMPQKDNDRKRIAWLFLLLFSVTAILLMIIKTWSTQRPSLSYAKENIIGTRENTGVKHPPNLGAQKENIQGEKPQEKNKQSINLTSTFHQFSSATTQPNGKLSESKPEKTGMNISHKTEPSDNKNVDENNGAFEKNIESFPAITLDENEQTKGRRETPADKIDGINIPDSAGKSLTEAALKTKNKASKNNKKFNSAFVLNFSTGPDVSAVNPGNIGGINPAYGAGIGYAIGKNWQFRSGFYITKKAYKAEASDYHPPAQFWTYYPDLEYIDADCKVYEVPLILNYNFSKTSKHIWFGSVGVSSYFMKKEKYYYFSKNPSVQYSYNSYTINNKNKHFLSSLRLSGGYAATLNKNISVITEPYVNLPLSGVGFGKVKLYSAGILFTVSIKPFVKK